MLSTSYKDALMPSPKSINYDERLVSWLLVAGTDIHYLSPGLFIFSFYPGPWLSASKDTDREIFLKKQSLQQSIKYGGNV